MPSPPTSIAGWQRLPVKTWNVRDKKLGETFQVRAKTRGNVIAELCDRWMLSESEVYLRATISVVRETKSE